MDPENVNNNLKNRPVDWLLGNGLRVTLLLGVLTVLGVLGASKLVNGVDSMARNLGDVFIILALLLIAALVWALTSVLKDNQAILTDVYTNMQTQLSLKESQYAHQQSQYMLEERQQHQVQMELIQRERSYLIEKAQLQPVFKVEARAFITPSAGQELPDEVWDEDRFIAKHFSEPDLFGVKLTFRQKGSVLFSHERLIFDRALRPGDRPGSLSNEAYVAMDEKEKPVYIIPLDELPEGVATTGFTAYYVYKDLTSLSVVMKFRVYQAIEGDANFWSVENLDICFSSAHFEELRLDSVENCEQIFERKYVNPLLVDG